MGKNDFKYLSEKLHSNASDLVKQKGFYTYEYASDFQNFKEELPSKESFCSFMISKKKKNGFRDTLKISLRRGRWKIITTCT